MSLCGSSRSVKKLFYLPRQTQQGIFTIDSSTGVVSTLMPLDYESTKFYQLKIMAFVSNWKTIVKLSSCV